jgi:tetratricopeptide (TPR) repeat protein
LTYSLYVEKPGWRRYLVLLACFGLGLMAKPMLVTLPFVLLLLDFWPLRRFTSSPVDSLPQRIRRLVLEKTPMLALAASSSILTFFVQDKGGAVTSIEALPMVFRLCNSVVAYVAYIEKLLWPVHLAVLYPYPQSIPIAKVVLSVLALTLITAFAVVMAKRRPYWVIGWLWYLGTMMPVIGIVRFGAHAMADRFAYIPFIGLYVAIVWASAEIGRRWKHGTMALGMLTAGVLLLLALATSYQLRFWQSSITLFRHALDVTRKNPIMHTNLGETLLRIGQTNEAATHCREAIRQDPGLPQPYSTMGKIMSRKRESESAIRFYQTALRLDPGYAPAHNGLGNEYVALERPPDAIEHYLACLQIEPEDVEAHNNLGLVLAGLGRNAEALSHYQSAIRLNPRYAEAHYNLAILLEDQNHAAGAEQHYRLAIAANPAMVQAHYNLGNLFMAEGRHREALAAFQAALAIRPEYAEAVNNMAMIRAAQGRIPEAIRLFQRALELKPDLLPAQQNLKVLESKAATNALTSPPSEGAAGP